MYTYMIIINIRQEKPGLFTRLFQKLFVAEQLYEYTIVVPYNSAGGAQLYALMEILSVENKLKKNTGTKQCRL